MSIKQTKAKFDFFEVKRISIYLYDAQLNKIDEICQKRHKPRRRVFLEAIQTYIALFEQGEV
jgi:metal-responsive CopG/Arc/MetJ family transcriptional regulator